MPKVFLLFEVHPTGQHFAVEAEQVRAFAEDTPVSTVLTLKDDVHINTQPPHKGGRQYIVTVRGSFTEVLKRMADFFREGD